MENYKENEVLVDQPADRGVWIRPESQNFIKQRECLPADKKATQYSLYTGLVKGKSNIPNMSQAKYVFAVRTGVDVKNNIRSILVLLKRGVNKDRARLGHDFFYLCRKCGGHTPTESMHKCMKEGERAKEYTPVSIVDMNREDDLRQLARTRGINSPVLNFEEALEGT